MQKTEQPDAEMVDFAGSFAALTASSATATAAEMAGQSIRMLAFHGTGGWHSHESAEETVVVWRGTFDVEYRDRTLRLEQGQCTIIPRGREHRGVSEAGAQVVLFRSVA